MKKKTLKTKNQNDGYEDAPEDVAESLRNAKIIYDLLPPPDKLVLKKAPKVKVTMDFDKRDVLFFKHEARKCGVSYQAMIKSVVRYYVDYSQTKR